jgi:hypothetical protein
VFEVVRRAMYEATHVLVLAMSLIDQSSREGEGLSRLEVRCDGRSLDLCMHIIVLPSELRPQSVE